MPVPYIIGDPYIDADFAVGGGGVGPTFAYRIITAAGTVTVLPTDSVLVFDKSPSGASTVNLPASALRNGFPVIIKDMTGDAITNNITIVPNGTDTIDGFSAAAAAANGVALIDTDYGSKWFLPITGGWCAL